jgi:hypothetical protein
MKQSGKKSREETQQKVIICIHRSLIGEIVPMNHITPFGHNFIVEVKNGHPTNNEIDPNQ